MRAGRTQLECAGRGLHHILRGHNAKSGARFQHQAGHFAGIGTGGDGNILEPPAQVALRVGHGRAEQCGQAHAG